MVGEVHGQSFTVSVASQFVFAILAIGMSQDGESHHGRMCITF